MKKILGCRDPRCKHEYLGPYLNDIGHNANNGNQKSPMSFKYGYFGHSIFPLLFKYVHIKCKYFRCYLSMTILTISILRFHLSMELIFFRCHLRIRLKVPLLFKYESD